jgi:hypothetical protein
MRLQQFNVVAAATWIMAAGIIGLAGNVRSIGGAALVLGFGLVPPIIMMLQRGAARPLPVQRTHP